MGMEEEEEKIPKGDDVIVDLHATLEDLYMGGSLKVTCSGTHGIFFLI